MAVVNKQALNYRLVGKHDSQILPSAIKIDDSQASEHFWKQQFGDAKYADWGRYVTLKIQGYF